MLKYDPSKLVFIDTETTGLYPHLGHEVWEIGLITWEPSLKTDESGVWVETTYHVPPDLTHADPIALAINRFYERTGPSFKGWHDPYQVALALGRRLAGQHLVGAIPSFDAMMLDQFLRAYGMAGAPWHYHIIDVEAMVLGFLAHKGGITGDPLELPLPWRSDWAFEQLGIEKDPNAHSALADAKKAKEVWDRITAP